MKKNTETTRGQFRGFDSLSGHSLTDDGKCSKSVANTGNEASTPSEEDDTQNANELEKKYVAHAGPYSLREAWMLENVKADLRRGGIDFIEIEGIKSTYIYRSRKGYIFPEKQRTRLRRAEAAE